MNEVIKIFTKTKHILLFRASIYAFLLLAFTAPTVSYAQITNVQQAINKAGKQRMLTQRMLKDYAMVGMNMDYSNPEDDLTKIISLFEKTNQELKAFNVNEDVTKSITNIESLWAPIKMTLSAPPNKKAMSGLQKDMEALLKACNKTTVLISDASGKKSGVIINLSGRQRMLSQRLASLYMIQAWGITSPAFDQHMSKVMSEFRSAQKQLEDSPLSTSEIQQELKNVKKNFQWFEMMGEKKTKKLIPSLIARSADRILKLMDAITNMYVKIK